MLLHHSTAIKSVLGLSVPCSMPSGHSDTEDIMIMGTASSVSGVSTS